MLTINYKIQGDPKMVKRFVDEADWEAMWMCVKHIMTMTDTENGNEVCLHVEISSNKLLPDYMLFSIYKERISGFEKILSAECKKFNVSLITESNPLAEAREMIGFNDEAEGRKCIKWINDTYGVSADYVLTDHTSQTEMYVIVPKHMADKVRKHFAKFIV